MTPLEVVHRALAEHGCKGKGNAWECPAHEDRAPSLSISAGADGKVLLFCHAGCDFAAIVRALGLEEGALFPPKDREGRRVVAEYSYRDEAGTELFQAVRFAPKDFRQRHRDASGAWTWSLNGVRRVLYRLPELLEGVKAGAAVFVVEGEKDVETIRALGLVATCNPMGAGKWRPEYAAPLTGARVVVIADKDEPGRKHAASVAASLRGKATSVSVVEVPTGKDASDFIATGTTREDFERLADEPEAAELLVEAGAPWIDLGRFREELRQITRTRISTALPTLDRATEGGISGDMVVLLVGPVGSCKTALAHQLARDRARVHGGRVYAYSPDQGGAQPLRRLASTFGHVAEDDDAFARFAAAVGPVLRVIDERREGVTVESFRDLVLAAGDVAAVVIDTPQTVQTAEDAEERQRIEKTMGTAREIAEKLLVPVYACSHANRASTAARKKEDRTLERSAGLGAAAIEHRAQVLLFMERRDVQDRTEIDVLIPKAPVAGLRFRLLLDVDAWTLREIDATEDTRETEERTKAAKVEKRNTERGERRAAIMAAVLGGPTDAGVSAARLREALGGRTEGIKPTLDVMIEDGLLEAIDGPKPKRGGLTPVHYRLRQTAGLSIRSVPPVEQNGRAVGHSLPLRGEGSGKTDLSPVVPGLSEASVSMGKTERERPNGGEEKRP